MNSIRLELDVSLGEAIACPISRPRMRRLILASLAAKPKTSRFGAMVNLLLCDVKQARSLNRGHRGKSYPPNVLSFEYPQMPKQPLQADIAICLPIVEKEAKQQGKTSTQHFMHMLVHGCLHAQGFDHQNEADAHQMEELEKRILRRFRVPDPYLA